MGSNSVGAVRTAGPGARSGPVSDRPRSTKKPARLELLVGDELGRRVQEADRQPDPLPSVEQVVAALRREERGDDVAHAVEDQLARRHVAQRRFGQLRGVVEQLEECLPVLHLVRCHIEEPVAALPDSGGRHADRDGAPTRAEALEVVRLPQHLLVLLHLLRRDVDELPADAVAHAERGEHRNRGVGRRDVPVQVLR